MFRPARQMVEGNLGTALAPEDRLAELICSPPTSGSRITTAFTHQESRLPRPRHQQESRLSCAFYLPARCELFVSVFDHCLRSRHYVNVWWPANTPATMAEPWTRRWCIARKELASAMGQQRPGRRAGVVMALLRRHAHSGDSGYRFHLRQHLPQPEKSG